MRKWLVGLIVGLLLGAAHAAMPAKTVLNVANMTCPACSITIEKALAQVPGIVSIKVDSAAGTVTVAFDAGRTTVKTIARAITDAGFPAKPSVHGG